MTADKMAAGSMTAGKDSAVVLAKRMIIAEMHGGSPQRTRTDVELAVDLILPYPLLQAATTELVSEGCLAILEEELSSADDEPHAKSSVYRLAS